MDQKLIFLHIPKAGGTTLLNVIERQYKRRQVLMLYNTYYRKPLDSITQIESYARKSRAGYHMIVGHFGYGVNAGLGNQYRYISMVRDPVQRVISNYLHMKRTPKAPLFDQLQKISFEQYLLDGLWPDANDGQVRRLCGVENEGNIVGFGKTSEDMFLKAVEAIERSFFCVALTEQFDRSLLLLQRILGWSNIHYVKRNISYEREAFSPSSNEIDIIRELNKYDTKLYSFVSQKFDAQCEQFNISTESVLNFQRENKNLSTWTINKMKLSSEYRRYMWALERRLPYCSFKDYS